jgi:HD superfamily phosphohydrolase
MSYIEPSKQISDPIYGTISLSKMEAEIISTKSFLRLRNIQQLGLAHYVFPSAGYTRFSHCLGVCHITGLLLNTLQKNSQVELDPNEIQQYRLAGLLHDIGHYPFSHAMERAVKNFYVKNKLLTQEEQQTDEENEQTEEEETISPYGKFTYLDHETLGKMILDSDREIREILERYGFDPSDISQIFTRENPTKFSNLVNSDLDADRIDYLSRTSNHTGLPYGNIDLNYLLSQTKLDRDNNICLTPKGIRTADHFLLGRYFDYLQVSFHKTVTAFERILEDVIYYLLQKKYVECNPIKILNYIFENRWHYFDEPHIIHVMRKARSDCDDTIIKNKLDSILERTPPKLVFRYEWFGPNDYQNSQFFKNRKRLVDLAKKEMCQHYSINKEYCYMWSKETKLTKVPSHIPSSAAEGGIDDHVEKQAQSIKIVNEDNHSYPIMESDVSLMKILSSYYHYDIRLYVLLSPFSISKDEIKRFLLDYLAE